jgi:RNA-directed DNA polymerase
MKIENLHITDIKTRFAAINCKQDVIDLINHVNVLLYGGDYKSLTEKGFNYYTSPKFSNKRYNTFSVRKKNGGERIIHAPVNGLKHILRPLNLILNCVAEPHFKATGFVPGKSIVDNAKQHIGKHYVYNIDLKDFFHSFDRNQVKMGFMFTPFNLSGDLEPIAFMFASLCTHPFEVDGDFKTVLPQGAPTSPTITNILCVKLDRRLNGLAKRFNITYSRYADDITFSSTTNIFIKEEFLDELNRIINDQKLEINPSKTRLQQTGYCQEVTGLIVNQKVNVNSRYIKQLRNWLYLWERYGYAKAEQKFKQDYALDKGHVKKGNPSFANVLLGKLEYLKMVKGCQDGTYFKLNERFLKLLQKDSDLEEILKVWENEGIGEAMDLFNSQNGQQMNKFEFIKEVLETKKFTSNQKDRFIRLVSSEFANLEAKDSKILADIKAIKEKIGLSEAPGIVVSEEKDVVIKNENDLKTVLFRLNLNYLEPVNKDTDPRNKSLNDQIDILSKVNYKLSNDKISFLQKIKEEHGGLNSENALKAIKIRYSIVMQIEVMNGDYESIGISRDTSVMPTEVTKFLIERFNEALKKTEDKEDENDLKEILLRFNLEYLESINRDIDPRNTSLEERMNVLSKVTDKSYKDRKPLLEITKEKHEDLGSEKAINGINRVYFMVKQIEVMNGEYEHLGISRNTNIIPPEIIKQIIERSKKSSVDTEEEYDDKDIEPGTEALLQKPLSVSNTNKKKYHDPNRVNNWLKYFTTDNTAIKFSTHVWDDNLYATYADYIEKLNDEYLKYDFHSLQKYSPDLYWNKIYPFLFQKKLTSLEISGKKAFGWGRHKIAVGWQYPSVLKDFCEENFDNKGHQARTPHTVELVSDLVPKDIPGKTIKTFENLVDLFKPEIEFRENQLWVGVKIALKKYLPNHNVDQTFLNKLKGCSFYTNTEYVLKAISRIFNMIKSRSESQDVNISCVLDSDTNQYILEILHLNSYSDMDINHPKLIAENNGDLSILRTTLLSLCDFSIESRFKDKNGDNFNAKIEYLYDNVDANEWKPNIESIDTNPGGFKFILKFLV